MNRIIVKNISELSASVPTILKEIEGVKHVLFSAEMGSGKTTLIGQIIAYLGMNFEGSPTYSIVNSYQDQHGTDYLHFDLYRLNDEEEVFDAGIEEALYSGAVCFIEWPELVRSLLPENVVEIRISVGSENERIIEILRTI